MSKQQFQLLLEEKGISLSSHQLEQFDTYYKTLVEWNEKMNLTAITDEDDVYLKHFYDSISAAFYYDFQTELNILDVGAGAGFPSLPLKICFPHINVHIVDSLNKRIGFLEHLAKEVGLKGVQFYHDRAEIFAKDKKHRESYDLVLARAVARMPVLSELCLPFVKTNGDFIAMKGADASEELREAQKAIRLLGADVVNDHRFTLPLENSERHIILIHKHKPTPNKFPRKPGTPNKQPIV